MPFDAKMAIATAGIRKKRPPLKRDAAYALLAWMALVAAMAGAGHWINSIAARAGERDSAINLKWDNEFSAISQKRSELGLRSIYMGPKAFGEFIGAPTPAAALASKNLTGIVSYVVDPSIGGSIQVYFTNGQYPNIGRGRYTAPPEFPRVAASLQSADRFTRWLCFGGWIAAMTLYTRASSGRRAFWFFNLALAICLVSCGWTTIWPSRLIPADDASIALGIFLAIAAVLFSFGLFLRRQAKMRVLDLTHCFKCGYDLHNNQSGRCPECGEELHPKQALYLSSLMGSAQSTDLAAITGDAIIPQELE